MRGSSSGRHVARRTWRLPSWRLPSWRRRPAWRWPVWRRPASLLAGFAVVAAAVVIVLAVRPSLVGWSSSSPRASQAASRHGRPASTTTAASATTTTTSAPGGATQPAKTGCASVTPGSVPVQAGTYALQARGQGTLTTPAGKVTRDITGGSLVVNPAANDSQTLELQLTGPALTVSQRQTFIYHPDGAHLYEVVSGLVSQGVSTSVDYTVQGSGYILPAGGFQTGQTESFQLAATSGGSTVRVRSAAQCTGPQAVTVGGTSDQAAAVVQHETQTVSNGAGATATVKAWLHPPSPLPAEMTGSFISTSANGSVSARIDYTFTLASLTPH